MNKRELADRVGTSSALAGSDAAVAVDAVFDAIAAALAAGDSVALPGFGTFEVRSRAARSGRNPQTGAAIEIAASRVPAFKPAAALKRSVNGLE